MKEGTRYNRGDDEGRHRGGDKRGVIWLSPICVIRDSRVRQRRESQKLPSTITKSLLDRPLPHAQDMRASKTAWSACGFHLAVLGRYWASLAEACMRVRLRSLDTAARLQREPRKWLHFQAFPLKSRSGPAVKSLIHRAPGVEAGPWVGRRRIRNWELGAETKHSRLTPMPNNRDSSDD